MIKKILMVCLSLELLAGCAGGPQRFKVPRGQFDRQVRVIAISPCECLIAYPSIYSDIKDPAAYQSLLCATTEARAQQLLTASGRYGIVDAQRCQTVKDSVAKALVAAGWHTQDSAEAGLTQKQLFARRYYRQLGADAALLVFFSTIGESRNTISPYRDVSKNEEGYKMTSGDETHIVLAARLVGPDSRTLWNNSVMLKRGLGPGDRAADIFAPERINGALAELLKDLGH